MCVLSAAGAQHLHTIPVAVWCCVVLQGAMEQSFGSTCHGAGRALSRSAAMRGLDSKHVSCHLAPVLQSRLLLPHVYLYLWVHVGGSSARACTAATIPFCGALAASTHAVQAL